MTQTKTIAVSDLIERLEGATGPVRVLDANIALSQGWTAPRTIVSGTSVSSGGFWKSPNGQECASLPRFTSSIDAALMLLTEGFAWCVQVAPWADTADDRMYEAIFAGWVGLAPTPALAICIAALKAKEADNG